MKFKMEKTTEHETLSNNQRKSIVIKKNCRFSVIY